VTPNYAFAVRLNDALCAETNGQFIWQKKRDAKRVRDFYGYGDVVRVKVTVVAKKRVRRSDLGEVV
jgi:hypothetical protein